MKYYIDWTRPKESIGIEPENNAPRSAEETLFSIQSILNTEYADSPQLMEFCMLIEDALNPLSEGCEDPISLLEALDELLWAYTLK